MPEGWWGEGFNHDGDHQVWSSNKKALTVGMWREESVTPSDILMLIVEMGKELPLYWHGLVTFLSSLLVGQSRELHQSWES